MATRILVDGTETTEEPADPRRGFTLEELYGLVECDMVEVVSLRDGRTMWIDEEGKMHRPPKPRNEKATRLLQEAGGIFGDWIAGIALIATPEETAAMSRDEEDPDA